MPTCGFCRRGVAFFHGAGGCRNGESWRREKPPQRRLARGFSFLGLRVRKRSGCSAPSIRSGEQLGRKRPGRLIALERDAGLDALADAELDRRLVAAAGPGARHHLLEQIPPRLLMLLAVLIGGVGGER